MYSPPKARDLVRVVVTARLTPVGTEDPADGIEPADGATIESTGVELDGAPVSKIVTEDGWQSISWRDPSGVRLFVASQGLASTELIELARTLRGATRTEVIDALVPFDPDRPRSEQLSDVVKVVPPPPLVPEDNVPKAKQG
jgi:hypothetical protein